MNRGLRLCLIVFLIGFSLLIVTVVRTNSVPRIMNFSNEDMSDNSGWVLFSDFLIVPREFRIDIRANDTVSVYILDETAIKQWRTDKTTVATWIYEDVAQAVFNEQANSRGGY